MFAECGTFNREFEHKRMKRNTLMAQLGWDVVRNLVDDSSVNLQTNYYV